MLLKADGHVSDWNVALDYEQRARLAGDVCTEAQQAQGLRSTRAAASTYPGLVQCLALRKAEEQLGAVCEWSASCLAQQRSHAGLGVNRRRQVRGPSCHFAALTTPCCLWYNRCSNSTRPLLPPFQLDSPDLERQACQVSRQLPLRVETGTAVWCAGVPALPVQLAPCRRLGRLPPLLLVHITYPAPPVHLCSGELSTPRRVHRCPTSPAYRRRQPSCSAGRCWRSRGSAGWRRLGRSAAAVIQGHICQHRWQAVQLDS